MSRKKKRPILRSEHRIYYTDEEIYDDWEDDVDEELEKQFTRPTRTFLTETINNARRPDSQAAQLWSKFRQMDSEIPKVNRSESHEKPEVKAHKPNSQSQSPEKHCKESKHEKAEKMEDISESGHGRNLSSGIVQTQAKSTKLNSSVVKRSRRVRSLSDSTSRQTVQCCICNSRVCISSWTIHKFECRMKDYENIHMNATQSSQHPKTMAESMFIDKATDDIHSKEVLIRQKSLGEMVSDLRSELDEKNRQLLLLLNSGSESKCVICLDKKVDSVFLQCMHATCCMDCGRKLHECPICRRNIVVVRRIYFSGF